MDANFLELLGNILVGTAKSKQQSDQFFKWLQSGFSDLGTKQQLPGDSGANEVYEMFRSWYGLSDISQQNEQYRKLSEEAYKKFQSSLKDTFLSMGFVPLEEHLALVEKHEKLKDKYKKLEETIDQHKILLQGQADMTDQFKDMVSKQGEVYQEMIEQFGTLFALQDMTPTDSKKTK